MNQVRSFFGKMAVEDSLPFKSLMRFYAAEARYSVSLDEDDREQLLATLHPEIVLHQPESLPYGGVWRGREAFGQWLDAFVEIWTDLTPLDPVFYPCGEETLISTVTMCAKARFTGRMIAMPVCQVIRFSDDLPIEWRNFAWDTAEMVTALSAQGRGKRRPSLHRIEGPSFHHSTSEFS